MGGSGGDARGRGGRRLRDRWIRRRGIGSGHLEQRDRRHERRRIGRGQRRPVPRHEPGDTSGPSDTSGASETTGTDSGASDSTAAAEPNYMSGDSDYLFDQDELHTFEINLSDEALAELDRDPAAEEYVEGSMTFEGETLDAVGVRYKGSIGAFLGCTSGSNPFAPSGAKTCTKLSMKVKINWDDSNAEFYGVRTVQLHSQNLDPSMMHERLGYWLFREMGVPAPRSTHARVVVNGEYVGRLCADRGTRWPIHPRELRRRHRQPLQGGVALRRRWRPAECRRR